MRKLTTEEFIEKAKDIHGDKYDYSLVDYISAKTKVKIVCPEHGVFYQTASDHLCKKGCPKCGGTKKITQEEFVQRAKEIHGNKYDYSLVNYKNNKTKVKIICPEHEIFEQMPADHLRGVGCPFCKGGKIRKKRSITIKKFIEKAKEIHGNKYDYRLVSYKNAKTKIKIICPKHGIFEQTPNNHLLSGRGCPKCRSSRGENKIRNFLQKNNILFEEQKRFKECKDERLLPFDFYLNNENILIEYQGIQHYKDAFGVGPEKFYKYKYHDFLKEEFAKKYGYNLITISYSDYNNIEQILSGLMIDKFYK